MSDIVQGTRLTVTADQAYDLSAGEHLLAEVATGATLTATLPLSSGCQLALVNVQRNGAGGTITVVAVDRDDALLDRDPAGISIGPGGDGCECLQFRAVSGGWVVVSRG